MATKPLPTVERLANLEQTKKERIARIEEQLKEQRDALISKRKDELFKLFVNHSALTVDDKLLVGFLKFISMTENKHHPILKEFKELASKSKIPSQSSKQNAE